MHWVMKNNVRLHAVRHRLIAYCNYVEFIFPSCWHDNEWVRPVYNCYNSFKLSTEKEVIQPNSICGWWKCQRWTSLFHRFDVFKTFLELLQKTRKIPALINTVSTLISSDFSWISGVQTKKSQRCLSENQLWISALQWYFLNSGTLGFHLWIALIQRWLTLNHLWY